MSARCPLLAAQCVNDVVQAVCGHRSVFVTGGGTKLGPWSGGSRQGSVERCEAPAEQLADSVTIDMRGLSGITEYDPGEYTFSAKAGTTLAEISRALARERQFLPFDPMFVEQGATLGGTVATGMNGPGRLRFGGVRDFILGVELVTGEGKRIRGGGKVVKNAAGFDLPKLMVGSLGKLGVVTEVAFKVFPEPEAKVTATCDVAGMREAVELVNQLARGPFEVEAIELLPPGRVVIRISGWQSALGSRLDELRRGLAARVDEMPPAEAAAFWRGALCWDIHGRDVIRARVPVTPAAVVAFDEKLERAGAGRRYSVACNAAFIDWPRDRGMAALEELLVSQELGGMCVGNGIALMGWRTEREFVRRVKAALDPANKFGEVA